MNVKEFLALPDRAFDIALIAYESCKPDTNLAGLKAIEATRLLLPTANLPDQTVTELIARIRQMDLAWNDKTKSGAEVQTLFGYDIAQLGQAERDKLNNLFDRFFKFQAGAMGG
jgi:hypothetical protein